MVLHADFLGIDIDLDELEGLLSRHLGGRYALEPLSVKCTYPVFRGRAEGKESVFVKIGSADEWQRTARLLDEVADCPLFARFVCSDRIDYRGFAVFAMTWKDVATVFPEDMNEWQVVSFVSGCERLSRALRAVTVPPEVRNGVLSPARLFDVVAAYAKRHALVGRLLAPLLSVPEDARLFGAGAVAVVHRDFHAKNYGFAGDAFAGVFDLGQVAEGLACEDLANALVERYSSLGLSAAARRRLSLVTRRILALMPWPREDFVRAVNVLRLRIAVRRLEKHPDAAWVAVDVWRRDRRICEIFRCLGQDGSTRRQRRRRSSYEKYGVASFLPYCREKLLCRLRQMEWHRLLLPRLRRRKCAHVIPFGVNCEVAFRFNWTWGFVESNLFNWSVTRNLEYLTGLLGRLDSLFSGAATLTDIPEWAAVLWKCERTGAYFHGNLKETGEAGTGPSEAEVAADLESLRGRVAHLREKFLRYLRDDCETVLVHRLDEGDLRPGLADRLRALVSAFERLGARRFRLVVLYPQAGKRFIPSEPVDRCVFRRVRRFNPRDLVTNAGLGDPMGWRAVFTEFAPERILPKKHAFKFE